MKVLPFKIPKPEQDAFVFQVDKDEVFYDKLHQHEEIQLSFIVEGEGTLIVGDTVNYYSKNDILVIGEKDAENITKFPYGPEKNIIKN